jgi:hypothetical protein
MMRAYRRFGEEEKKVALQHYIRLGPLGASHMFLHPAFLGVRHLDKIYFFPPQSQGTQLAQVDRKDCLVCVF